MKTQLSHVKDFLDAPLLFLVMQKEQGLPRKNIETNNHHITTC